MGAAFSLLASVAVPLGGGVALGLLTQEDVKGWYVNIKKPTWTPPNWVFAPAWTTLYTSMGIASWLVLRSTKGSGKALGLSLYAAQLALNFAWTPLFFKAHKLDAALLDISAMLGLATAATVAMSKAAHPAAITPLMAPYLAWLTYATALNARILSLNPEETLVDYSKLSESLKKGAKETGEKVVAAGKEVSDKAAAAAAEVAKKAAEDTQAVAAAAKGASEKVAAKVGEVASDVKEMLTPEAPAASAPVAEAVEATQ